MSLARPRSVLLSLASLLAPLAGQDPPPPPGGFGVVPSPDHDVTWSDGFRTKMDLYGPNAAPPATGWPAVMVIHGGGGHRKLPEVVSACMGLASAGYLTFAYDVRGDGDTPVWNPGFPHPITNERKLIDAAESFGLARGFAPAGVFDLARLGATGFSQGGSHATEAAAWSGRALPADPSGAVPYVTHYPVVLAVCPENNNLDAVQKSMPGGVLANDEFIDDMPPTDPLLLRLNAGDYAGAFAGLSGSFGAGTLPLMRTSIVPMFAMYAWQDFKHQLNPGVDAMPTLLPGVPRRLLLTTGGHTTPKNRVERALLDELQRRWFDRFLKGRRNGVELETYCEVAVQADEPAHTDLGSHWAHRQSAVWPPAVPRTAWYLRAGGVLSPSAATAPELGPLFQHRVRPGYDLLAYVQARASKNPSRLVGNMSLVEHVFETAPLPVEAEVFGRVHVELVVDDTTGTTQISVELQHVDPNGTVQHVTIGAGGVRGAGAGRHTLAFDLGDIAHRIPAGHRLRATVRNMALHRPPSYQRIRFAPYFTDTDTTIAIEPGAASRLEIPLRAVGPTLVPRIGAASVASGIAHAMTLDGGSARAGRPYFAFLSASGEAPGLSLPGFPHLPLNLDAWTSLGIALQNSAAFPSFAGLLDAQGRAAPAVNVPAGPANALLGLRLTFAGLVLDAGLAVESAFGPVQLAIGP